MLVSANNRGSPAARVPVEHQDVVRLVEAAMCVRFGTRTSDRVAFLNGDGDGLTLLLPGLPDRGTWFGMNASTSHRFPLTFYAIKDGTFVPSRIVVGGRWGLASHYPGPSTLEQAIGAAVAGFEAVSVQAHKWLLEASDKQLRKAAAADAVIRATLTRRTWCNREGVLPLSHAGAILRHLDGVKTLPVTALMRLGLEQIHKAPPVAQLERMYRFCTSIMEEIKWPSTQPSR